MEMEKDLAKGRGNIECAGVGKDSAKKSDGAKYGVTEQTLKERFAVRRDVSFLQSFVMTKLTSSPNSRENNLTSCLMLLLMIWSSTRM